MHCSLVQVVDPSAVALANHYDTSAVSIESRALSDSELAPAGIGTGATSADGSRYRRCQHCAVRLALDA
jgi:hypothetical protein